MQFTVGDKVLFKKDDLKGEIIRINSLYKVKVLTDDGFEMDISIKDLVKVEKGTDQVIAYGEALFPKDNPQKVSYEPWHWRFEGTVEALREFESANENRRQDESFN